MEKNRGTHIPRDLPWKIIGIMAVIIVLAAASHVRNRVWGTKLSLWSDAAQKSAQKSRTRNNLGNCYMLLDRPFKAIEEYRAAIALDAENIEAYYNLAMNLEKTGFLSQAAFYYEHFCRAAPPVYGREKLSSCRAAQVLTGYAGPPRHEAP
jgi:tetratricopeptide (TPR) repeat protein